MAELRPRVAVVWRASSLEAALALAADHLGVRELPPPSRLCPRCGSEDHGQPYFRGLRRAHVSISRTTPDVLVVAVSLGALVGIDVEQVVPSRFAGVDEVARHPWEESAGPRASAVRWVRKEALVKAWGTGLSGVDLRQVRVSKAGEPARVLAVPPGFDVGSTWLSDLTSPQDTVAALAVLTQEEVEVTVLTAGPARRSRGARPAPAP